MEATLISIKKYVDFLCDICRIETPTSDKARIDKMVDFIEAFAKNEDFIVERIPFEKAGDCLLITLAGDNTKSPAYFCQRTPLLSAKRAAKQTPR